jgi:hypothetical protein
VEGTAGETLTGGVREGKRKKEKGKRKKAKKPFTFYLLTFDF